ncbi:hypothetical protein ACP70R_023119 [Stipagrostis hirtigluma subsp. patula]
MATTPVLRLLSLLFLLLPLPLREYLSARHHRLNDANTGELHPIVLLPGLSCSDYEARLTNAYQPSVPHCGAMKGKGWFGLWENTSDLVAHDYARCFQEQMRLVYDPVINDYRNLPGVETRLPNFGSARGFHYKKPLHPEYCLGALRDALEKMGYRDGDTLFGTPYDIRRAPPLPTQSSEVFSVYFKQFMQLVEHASKKNHHKKVILFGHSFGGHVALEFIWNTALSWRKKYIKHLILVAPTPSAGFIEPVKNLISGTDMIYVPTATPMFLRSMWRSFESAIVNLPSTTLFGHKPLVITKQRNYSAYDMEDLLTAIGFRDGVEPFKRRALPKMNYFQAPMVPVTCFNGVGNKTPQQLIYWDSDFNKPPELVYGDGDGKVNLMSMLDFDRKMYQRSGQKNQFKSIKLDGAQHTNIITEEWALQRIMQEIIEANRISS